MSEEIGDREYFLTMDLNVLNHLGLNLYSNVPAVLTEVVANSWDADATRVDIVIDPENDEITITDDGTGMSRSDINSKYLYVGYQKRNTPEGRITQKKRKVMGRKGIGKLSLFSIARIIELQSVKGEEKAGFVLDTDKIKQAISNSDPSKREYFPDPLLSNRCTLDHTGTKITLRSLKNKLDQTPSALRKRLARRFGIIGEKFEFQININGQPVQISDREYYRKLQYIWYYGEESKEFVDHCDPEKIKKNAFLRDNILKCSPESYSVTGWIGTVSSAGDLKDREVGENLNKIIVLTRGRLAQEDILGDFSEGGLYSKYLIGEIYADFLDIDELDDIATSNRQEIIREDPRYKCLREWLQRELKEIQNNWTGLRGDEGEKEAMEIAAIREWFDELPRELKKEAKKLFGRINQLNFETESERREMFKYGIIAFESLRYKYNTKALEKMNPNEFHLFSDLFSGYDDIEATLYYQIVNQRLTVIKQLHEHVENDDLEKVVQQYLFDHLWLLDPSWERATETGVMEKSVGDALSKIILNKEERLSRIDIRYQMLSGKHVIIELKKPGRSINSNDLMKQVDKYKRAFNKCLDVNGRRDEPLEVICLLGKPPSNWSTAKDAEAGRDGMARQGVRILMYRELIDSAYRQYTEFLRSHETAGRVHTLLQKIDKEVPERSGIFTDGTTESGIIET